MKILIESTSKVVRFNGLEARIWEGQTDTGVPVHCFVTRIAPTIPRDDPRQAQFERELEEKQPPTPEMECYPLRMIL